MWTVTSHLLASLKQVSSMLAVAVCVLIMFKEVVDPSLFMYVSTTFLNITNLHTVTTAIQQGLIQYVFACVVCCNADIWSVSQPFVGADSEKYTISTLTDQTHIVNTYLIACRCARTNCLQSFKNLSQWLFVLFSQVLTF